MKSTLKSIVLMLVSLIVFSCSSDEMSEEKVNLQVSISSIEFQSKSGNELIHVSSNQDWTATCDASWITLKQGAGHDDTGHLLISAADLDDYDDRSADVIITSGEARHTIHVTQKATHVLSFEYKNYEASNKGVDFSIALKTNADYELVNTASWITINETRAVGEKALKFTVAPNTTEQDRQAIIAVIDKRSSLADTLYVHQNETDVFRFKGNTAYVLDYTSQNITFEIENNISYTTTVSADASSWLQQTSTRAITTDVLNFKALKNETYAQRSGSITIKSDMADYDISVIQDYDHTPQGKLNYQNITTYLNDDSIYTMELKLNYDCGVTWSSSNDSIATIDNCGKITPNVKGEVTITGTSTDGKVTQKCNLKVKEITDDLSMSIDVDGTSNAGKCVCNITNNSTKSILLTHFKGSFNMNYMNFSHEEDLNKTLKPSKSNTINWSEELAGNKLIFSCYGTYTFIFNNKEYTITKSK